LVARINPDGSKWLYHDDHLGSTSLITDENGTIVEETFYTPFGQTTSGGVKEAYLLYTNQFKDAIGCYDYGTRVYCQKWYHFTSGDLAIQSPYLPQSLNHYSYVWNNPYKHVDSSGNFVDVIVDVGFIGYDIYTIAQDPTDTSNYIALGLDVAGAALPFATGLGVAGRAALKGADKAADIAKIAEKAAAVSKTADGTAGALSSIATDLGTAANRFEGTALHKQAQNAIKQSGIPNVYTEVSVKGGQVVPYGTKGSIRLDVIESAQDLSKVGTNIDTSQIKGLYDFKFGKQGVTPSYQRKIKTALGDKNINVQEIRADGSSSGSGNSKPAPTTQTSTQWKKVGGTKK
jgi:RHS repeat-associated protein